MINPSPPPVPLHQSTAFIHSTKNDSLFSNSSVAKRNSDLSLIDYDSTSDESDADGLRYSSSEEHQFWQVHSSTTIIAPPTLASDMSAISMDYVNPKTLKKPRKALCLATQVQHILGSTLDEVDKDIEREWDQSRTQLEQALIYLPNISLLSTQS
jgi:hypothetical protein